MKTEVLKNFIVLEGLDGSGTTTQLKSLKKLLLDEGLKVNETFEPTDGAIGKLIRKVLQKEYLFDPKTTAKLYSSDRHEHIYGRGGIKESIARGEVVICDRYLFSSLAYQTPLCGFEYSLNLNIEYPLPEHLFFIEVPVDVCQERINKRGDAKELFDAKEYQQMVHDNYLKAINYFRDSTMKIHIIDGTKSPENITNEIREILR